MRSAFLSVLFVLLPLALAAQEMPVQVNLDHGTFAYDADNSLVEVYLAIEAAGLDYQAGEDGFMARLPVALALYRGTDARLEGTPAAPVWQDATELLFSVPDTSRLQSGQQFVHQMRLLAPPGEYELRLTLPATAARAELSLRRDVIVPDYADATTARLSDVTLASQIMQGQDAQDPFFKNGLIVRPNATQLFGEGLPRMFYYAELYHPGALVDGQNYTLLTYVSEANRPQPVGDLQRRAERAVRAVDVLAGSFSLSELPSGPYLLRLVVLNSANEAVVEQQRRFFVYNPGVAATAAGNVLETTFETSPYAVMPEAEVDRMVAHIDPIASEGERRRLRNLSDLEARQRFLMDFWVVRDPNPATEMNEYKDAYYQRLQYADDRYSVAGREGWRTERGRVLLKYGMPSSIDPHLFTRERKPYEIWIYNNIPGEGQAQFIFYDPNGFGDFRLLHATVSGERQNPDWERELQR